jgi:hypothetical protein
VEYICTFYEQRSTGLFSNVIKCRDRQMASALGKPMMIQDVDCDVEPITLDDFNEKDTVQSRLFFIEQCKLAVLRKGS